MRQPDLMFIFGLCAWRIEKVLHPEPEPRKITVEDFFVEDLQLGAIAHSYWKQGYNDLNECFRLARNELYGRPA